MGNLIYSLIAFGVIYIIFKVFSWPIKIMTNLLINGFLGVVLLVLVNYIGQGFGVIITINVFTALVAGFLGIPGVLLLILLNLFM